MIVAENLDDALPIVCNAGDDAIRRNVEAACALPIPWLDLVEAHEQTAIEVGGGATATLGDIMAATAASRS